LQNSKLLYIANHKNINAYVNTALENIEYL